MILASLCIPILTFFYILFSPISAALYEHLLEYLVVLFIGYFWISIMLFDYRYTFQSSSSNFMAVVSSIGLSFTLLKRNSSLSKLHIIVIVSDGISVQDTIFIGQLIVVVYSVSQSWSYALMLGINWLSQKTKYFQFFVSILSWPSLHGISAIINSYTISVSPDKPKLVNGGTCLDASFWKVYYFEIIIWKLYLYSVCSYHIFHY